jgi:hypothetical protein
LFLGVLTQWGTGHLIYWLGFVVPDVIVHARVVLMVERRSHHARGVDSTIASEMEIGALRVELGGAKSTGRVEGENLGHPHHHFLQKEKVRRT